MKHAESTIEGEPARDLMLSRCLTFSLQSFRGIERLPPRRSARVDYEVPRRRVEQVDDQTCDEAL